MPGNTIKVLNRSIHAISYHGIRLVFQCTYGYILITKQIIEIHVTEKRCLLFYSSFLIATYFNYDSNRCRCSELAEIYLSPHTNGSNSKV